MHTIYKQKTCCMLLGILFINYFYCVNSNVKYLNLILGCGNHKSACNNGKCIPDSLWCDGNNDCGNWDDEKHCRKSITCINTYMSMRFNIL